MMLKFPMVLYNTASQQFNIIYSHKVYIRGPLYFISVQSVLDGDGILTRFISMTMKRIKRRLWSRDLMVHARFKGNLKFVLGHT